MMHEPRTHSAERPTLPTPRLLLRPFVATDAGRVQHLAGHERVAAGVASIPHPYPDGEAERWIAGHEKLWQDEAFATFAVCTHADATDGEAGVNLIGCMSVMTRLKHRRADLGWWFGVDYWNRGYCTEAARAVLAFAFDVLDLHRVGAAHYGNNPASGRVMQKLGMRYEGTARDFFLVHGAWQDEIMYGLLAADYHAAAKQDQATPDRVGS